MVKSFPRRLMLGLRGSSATGVQEAISNRRRLFRGGRASGLRSQWCSPFEFCQTLESRDGIGLTSEQALWSLSSSPSRPKSNISPRNAMRGLVWTTSTSKRRKARAKSERFHDPGTPEMPCAKCAGAAAIGGCGTSAPYLQLDKRVAFVRGVGSTCKGCARSQLLHSAPSRLGSSKGSLGGVYHSTVW